MADDLPRAKAALQVANAEGYSVYDHVFDIVTKALEDKKGFAPDALPEFSRTVKGHRFQHASGGEKAGWQPSAIDPRDIARAAETKTLFDRSAPVVETKIERPRPNVTVTTTEVRPVTSKEPRPLALDVRYHRMCGVGLPRHECFLLDQSITRLVQEKQLSDVRFFGKIFGTNANYIVVSSKRWCEDPDEQFFKEKYQTPAPPRKKLEVPVQPEPPGQGLNRVTFWVCPYAGASWTPLPDVTPQQINSARKMKKYFTGNLEEPVNSYPPFHGTEKNLLRAQLARISAASLICPEGEREKTEIPEEEEEEDEAAANKGPKPLKWLPLTNAPKPVGQDDGIAAFKDLAKWQHCSQYIFKDGRCGKVPEKPEPPEGEEEPPPEDEEEEGQNEEDKEEAQQAFRDDFLGGGVGLVGGDSKYGLLKLPPEPKQEEEGEEGEGEGEGEKQDDEDDDDEPPKDEAAAPEADEDDPDPNKKWRPAWIGKTTNDFYKKHGVALMRSVRWPGSYAWLGGGERQVSGCVYFGDGMKATDAAFRPHEAPRIQGEPADILEIADPTVMNEKLVLRGEEPQNREEDDEPDEEEEPAADE